MSALTKDQIEDIVHFRAPQPRSHASLTLSRQVQYLERAIAQAQVLAGDAVERVEEVARDSKGRPVLDEDGTPKIVEIRKFKRDTCAKQERAMLDRVRNDWRAWLAIDNKTRSERNEEVQRAIRGTFGDKPSPDDRAEIDAFARRFRAEKGWN